MYSYWYRPSQQNEDPNDHVPTDYEALHRDEQTHQKLTSQDSKITPLDLETVLSSKAAVKFWYLHRPNTMKKFHLSAVKIQSLGRAYAVRRLIEKYGVEYTVELAKLDAEKREQAKLAELSQEELEQHHKNEAEYEARVAETKRLRREQMQMEQELESAEKLRESERVEKLLQEQKEAEAAAAEALRRKEEDERLAAEKAAEEERLAAERKAEEERLAAEEAAESERLEAERKAEEERLEAERKAEEEKLEAERKAEEERLAAEKAAEEERLREIQEQEEAARAAAEAAEIAKKAEEEAARAREEERIRQEQNEKYEQSLSKDVPVIVTGHGRGTVEAYDKTTGEYSVNITSSKSDAVFSITVNEDDVELDDERILSPKTVVDTPFGVGEVVGLDPHVGCYAIHTDGQAPDGERNLAFVQLNDVAVHVEDEEKAIVDTSLPIPDEIGLKMAKIIDNRVVHRPGQRFIQYKLEIQTTNYGVVYCWKRYSTFRNLCERLLKEKHYKKKEIPELPKRHIVGNFSPKTIAERMESLNQFLYAACTADHLQWGIRVDDEIAVYKRRVKAKKPSKSSKSRR